VMERCCALHNFRVRLTPCNPWFNRDKLNRPRRVAYLRLADNSRGPLLSRLRGLSPPVVRSRNGLSAPYAALLSCLLTHRSCLLTYRSRAVGRSFAWFIRYCTWGCGQGGTR
jgi:hypothetical protein